jgi:DNA adenine methylase
MLRRLGNKKKLLPKLLDLFPDNITTFIDMFMGSGAVTFAMENRVNRIIANDVDNNVFTLFLVVKENKTKLLENLDSLPIHETLFKHWKDSEEQDPIWKATRFLMLSNLSYLGNSDTLSFCVQADHKKKIYNDVLETVLRTHVKFMCCDFREVLPKISWNYNNRPNNKDNAFIYSDPPYLNTTNNYTEGFTEADSTDLFEILVNSGIRFAMSEFDHPFILGKAKEYGLHVTSLGERRNLKNRRTEILVTNYNPARKQMTVFDVLQKRLDNSE